MRLKDYSHSNGSNSKVSVYQKRSYHHCCSGIEAAQRSGGQLFIDVSLDKVVGVVCTGNDQLRQRESQFVRLSHSEHWIISCAALAPT